MSAIPIHRCFRRDPQLRARARWLEEFADTRMGEVFIWHLFNQLVIRRFVWGEAPDEQVLHARARGGDPACSRLPRARGSTWRIPFRRDLCGRHRSRLVLPQCVPCAILDRRRALADDRRVRGPGCSATPHSPICARSRICFCAPASPITHAALGAAGAPLTAANARHVDPTPRRSDGVVLRQNRNASGCGEAPAGKYCIRASAGGTASGR